MSAMTQRLPGLRYTATLYMYIYRECIHTVYSWGLIFANFVICVKFIHKNQIIYMVHTLFWINSQIFDLVKITQYTVHTHTHTHTHSLSLSLSLPPSLPLSLSLVSDRWNVTKGDDERSSPLTIQVQVLELHDSKVHACVSFSALMLDEAHERTIGTDIIIGLLKKVIL